MAPPSWRRYLRFWRSDVDADLDEEFRFHVDAEVEHLVARGWSAEAARHDALRRFGDVDAFRRDSRAADERRIGRAQRQENFAVLAQDLRFALRSLRRTPAFTAVTVLTLALGIGANTAIFSVINGVMLKPLPYRDPHRLVMLWETRPGGDRPLMSYPNYLDWRQRQRGFEDVAVYNPFASFTMTGQGDAEDVDGTLVSGNYFQLVGIHPALGRLIAPMDDSLGAARVVVLGNGFFQSRFGGDPSIIGRTLLLDNEAYTVVGVVQPDARVSYRAGDADPDVVLPLRGFTKNPMYSRDSPVLFGVGRLKAGVSVKQALSDLQRVSGELRAEYPAEDVGLGAAAVPMMDLVVRFIKPALQILMAAVAFVLLIACANVASLVLSRSAARQREFAIRTALGAARGRIVRQVLTESVVLAMAGGLLGVGIAVLSVKLLSAMHPHGIPRMADIAVNQTVLVFAFVVSVVTGVLFGLAPAIDSGHAQLANALKEGGRGTSGASKQRTRTILTVAEVAAAVLLLTGAGLLMRSFARLSAVDPGFQPSHVVAAGVRLPAARYPRAEQTRAALDELLAKVRAIPGVKSASLGSSTPISPHAQSGVSFQSRAKADARKPPVLNVAVVEPNYFQTLGIPLASGRMLATSDAFGQPQVVVISERVARKFFRNANPIGERLKVGQTASSGWRTIVGVVKDTRTDGLSEAPRGTVYLPRAQEEMRGGFLFVRSPLPVDQITRLLRASLREVDRDVPLELVRTMDAVLSQELQGPRTSMLLLTLFACIALALASMGIYGVISYNVTQRTTEIGVRVALGAQRGDVVRLVVGQAMALAAGGVGIGVLLALWSGKSLSAMLFGVGPRDPVALGGASVFLLAVALIAALAPALRASRIDPTIAMRGG
ncbi:MAG: ADOP family duplicated permease [Gemmatimonadaceae bacterium]